ncbi:MAG: DM13 domain-containing protein [Thermodesulfobacteriota bacterium]
MRKLIIALGLVVIVIAWYLFRPEKLFINENVNEGLVTASSGQSDSPRLITEGIFHGVAHETKGTASIYELPDGKRVLRLTGFETSNGPDVRVFLGAAQDANDNDTVTNAGYIELGALKGNIGDQNYEIPADVTLADYHSVTIWCKRFGVNFGTAPLIASN